LIFLTFPLWCIPMSLFVIFFSNLLVDLTIFGKKWKNCSRTNNLKVQNDVNISLWIKLNASWFEFSFDCEGVCMVFNELQRVSASFFNLKFTIALTSDPPIIECPTRSNLREKRHEIPFALRVTCPILN
jgi:hypothetical protein